MLYLNHDTMTLIQINALGNVVCKITSILCRPECVNWSASMICANNITITFFQHTSNEIVLSYMPWNAFDDKSTLAQGRAWYHQDLALLTLSWDKNWDSHSLVNGYPSFYPRIALVAPSPGCKQLHGSVCQLISGNNMFANSQNHTVINQNRFADNVNLLLC